MSRATVELDFFGMEKENFGRTRVQKLFDRQRNFRGIPRAGSMIDPEILKMVIASGSAGDASNEALPASSPPSGNQQCFPFLPVFNPIPGHVPESGSETAPMTIFYNGNVFVFNLPADKAESIFKLAAAGNSQQAETVDHKPAHFSSPDQQQLLESLDGDLPIARRKSLHRFLAKRKERLVSVAP